MDSGSSFWLMIISFIFQLAMQIIPQVLQGLMDMLAQTQS